MIPSQPQSTPQKSEIEHQLARILSAKVFKSKQVASDILRLLVSEALEGRTLTQKDIRKKLFTAPGYQPLTPLVRTHISKIRQSLREYYRDHGLNDPVLISLPIEPRTKRSKLSKAGERSKRDRAAASARQEGYPVHFSYNRDDFLIRVGLRFLAEPSPYRLRRALQIFEQILSRDPEHVAAMLGRAECLCIMALFSPNVRTRSALINDALTASTNALAKDPTYWQAKVVAAAALLCDFKLSRAAELLVDTLDPQFATTHNSFWIVLVHLLQNNFQIARTLSKYLTISQPENPVALMASAFYLYLTSDFIGAEEQFMVFIDLHKDFWLAYLGLSLVCLSTERPKDALTFHAKATALLPENDVVVMPSVARLASLRIDREAPLPDYVNADWEAWLALPQTQKDWTQGAIAMIDLDPALSVRSLSMAIHRREPLVLLLPFWPIFDPLREREDFKELISQIKATLT